MRQVGGRREVEVASNGSIARGGARANSRWGTDIARIWDDGWRQPSHESIWPAGRAFSLRF